jgi:aspartate-semialdehyde dehydrogenase
LTRPSELEGVQPGCDQRIVDRLHVAEVLARMARPDPLHRPLGRRVCRRFGEAIHSNPSFLLLAIRLTRGQQTVAVLSFHKLKTDVFDAQLSFNMLARYGEEAMEPLEGVEQRIERHLASLLAAYPAIPMPSLRLIQAPVFHGHSFSVWVEFEENPGPQALARELAEADVDVRPDDPPTNVSIAGQSGLSVGAIANDSNQPRAAWIWMVADNLRLAAENALAVARERWQ